VLVATLALQALSKPEFDLFRHAAERVLCRNFELLAKLDGQENPEFEHCENLPFRRICPAVWDKIAARPDQKIFTTTPTTFTTAINKKRPFHWLLCLTTFLPPMPVIGFLGGASPEAYARRLVAFHQALKETGYVNGQNVEVEYRWAEGQNNRLPALAAELVHRQVAVIAATGTAATLAAKSATTTIPVVFSAAVDPVAQGLVASLKRPGGNLTGVTSLNVEVGRKRLELLHEVVPSATSMALLVNPTTPSIAEPFSRALQAAARVLGLQLHVLHASSEREIEVAFATLVKLGAGGLVIMPDQLFIARSEQLAALTVRHAVPAIYQYRDFRGIEKVAARCDIVPS
jgi:putative tryptophan/tyrosine transport system substrate-binding protein